MWNTILKNSTIRFLEPNAIGKVKRWAKNQPWVGSQVWIFIIYSLQSNIDKVQCLKFGRQSLLLILLFFPWPKLAWLLYLHQLLRFNVVSRSDCDTWVHSGVLMQFWFQTLFVLDNIFFHSKSYQVSMQSALACLEHPYILNMAYKMRCLNESWLFNHGQQQYLKTELSIFTFCSHWYLLLINSAGGNNLCRFRKSTFKCICVH